MKGDFSRLGPWPDDTVTGVWLQQGRPLLDADWNDMQHVLRRMSARSLDALLGGPAGPAADLGFAVEAVARLALNTGGASGQRLVFDRSASLPFGAAALAEEVAEEIAEAEDLPAPLLDRIDGDLAFAGHGGRPYAIEIAFEPVAGASGLVLSRPGHVTVGVDRDGTIRLGGGEGGSESARSAPAERRCRLALVFSGHRYRLFLDGEAMAERRGAPVGERQGPVLSIGAEPDGSASLACRLDAVRIWRLRHHRGRPSGRLVADLDLGAGRGARIPDRTRHGNGGRIEGERPAPPSTELRLGRGRYVVGGLSVSNPSPIPIDLGAVAGARGVGLVYLDVFERTVGALEDPALREIALGGVDTVVETRSTWRAGVVVGADADTAWAGFRGLSAPDPGRAEFEHSASPAGNSLYRAEVHDPGWCLSWPLGPRATAAAWPVAPMAPDRLPWPAGETRPHAGAPLLAFSDAGDHWLLRVTGGAPSGEVAVTGNPTSWPAERVSLLPIASFKWSPDNAAAAYGIARMTAVEDAPDGRLARVQLGSVGFNGLDLHRGDWVELCASANHESGRLHPVAAFDGGLLQVDLGDEGGDGGSRRGGVLRRWGPAAARSADGAYPVVLSAEFADLDADVSVRFRPDARYAAGEAWTLPLRQAEDDAWTSTRRLTGALAAEGSGRTVVPLALVRFGQALEIEDLRRSFRDLPALSDESRRPPPAERRVDSGEAARWLSRHLPGIRLVGAGTPPPGFRRVGSVDCRASPEATRWHRVPAIGPGPSGPGRAASGAGGLFFVEEGRPGAWRWTDHARWVRLKDRPEPRTGFSVVAVGGGVAVVGGATGDGEPCQTIDLLVPGDEWARLPCDATPGLGSAAAMVGAFLYITGGRDDAGAPTNRCEAVDLRTGRAYQARAMRQARADHGMAAVGDTCWIVGGIVPGGREIADAEAYDAALDRWRVVAPLRVPAVGPATAVLGRTIAVAGGLRRGRPSDEVAIYEPGTDRWSALARLPEARRGTGLAAEPASAAAGSGLLVMAGEGSDGADMFGLALNRRLGLWAGEEDETWP